MIIYNSAAIYIQNAKTLRDKITRIDAIIEALEDTALIAASTDNITSYSLDDGQTKINTVYRGAQSVFNSINAFIRMRQLYVERLNGRVIRLVDGKNFTNRRGYGNY